MQGSANDPRAMYVNERMGRDAQARAARVVAAKDGDRQLQRLLARDKEGTRALASAREFAKRQAEEAEKEREKAAAKSAKGKGREKGKGKRKAEEDEGRVVEEKPLRKNAYSAELIKQLGFDPAGKDGRPTKDAGVQSKVSGGPAFLQCLLLITVASWKQLRRCRRNARSNLGPDRGRRAHAFANLGPQNPNPRAMFSTIQMRRARHYIFQIATMTILRGKKWRRSGGRLG